MSSTAPGTDERLREALEALASGVHPAPDAYRVAQRAWHRRERRRRMILAALIAAVFALATGLGLWVLNEAPTGPGIGFTGAQPATSAAPTDRGELFPGQRQRERRTSSTSGPRAGADSAISMPPSRAASAAGTASGSSVRSSSSG